MAEQIQTCFLCCRRPVSSRKSHFTPATATEEIFGERNKEEVYTVTSSEGKVDTYFGRANTKNTNPAVKKNPITEPNVFCKECEENLSKIEGQVTPLLKKVIEGLRDGSIRTKRTGKFHKYIELPIHASIFSLYLYSVIWRQAFQQIYIGQDEVLSKRMYDKLREAIATLIELKEDAIIASPIIQELPPIICLTSTHGDNLSDCVNPNATPSNPELFFMGAYDCLIFDGIKVAPGFRMATGLKIDPLDKDLFINVNLKSRICVLPVEHWIKKREHFYSSQASKYTYYLSSQISLKKGISILAAKKLLHTSAMELSKRTNQAYGECVDVAYQSIIN